MKTSFLCRFNLPHNKRLRQIRNARNFQLKLNFVFTVQWVRLGGRRRSLLNAALAILNKQVEYDF